MTEKGLAFDYDLVCGEKIVGVFGQNRASMNDGCVTCDAVFLETRVGVIQVSVLEEFDELQVNLIEVIPQGTNCSNLNDVLKIQGQVLSWAWTGENYRGYVDSFVLSFGETVEVGALDPRLMFVAVASSVQLYSHHSNVANGLSFLLSNRAALCPASPAKSSTLVDCDAINGLVNLGPTPIRHYKARSA